MTNLITFILSYFILEPLSKNYCDLFWRSTRLPSPASLKV